MLLWASRKGLKTGRTPKGAYFSRGRSRHLLEIAFSEPLLRTLFYCKTHSRLPSQNPSENPLPRTLPRTFSEPFLERCVAVRPLRRAPKFKRKPISRQARQPLQPSWFWEAADMRNCPRSESSRKWLGEGAKGLFWTPRARGLLHWCEMGGCTGAKEGLGGAKDSWETFAPWAQKSQNKPFAPSPNHFWRLPHFGKISHVHSIPTLVWCYLKRSSESLP